MTGGHVPRDTEHDERLVRYLLGELSDEERYQLEAVYVANHELHDELIAVEDELIYTYVGGRLSPSQSVSFERFFCKHRRGNPESNLPARSHSSWKRIMVFRVRQPCLPAGQCGPHKR